MPRARSVLAPAARCGGELIERLEHKTEWRPPLKRAPNDVIELVTDEKKAA
jgi:hypothetical protein